MRKVCSQGHIFEKSSDCPACPVCAAQGKPLEGPLSVLPAPARRALLAAGIDTAEKLRAQPASELMKLHGFGPKSIRLLREAGWLDAPEDG